MLVETKHQPSAPHFSRPDSSFGPNGPNGLDNHRSQRKSPRAHRRHSKFLPFFLCAVLLGASLFALSSRQDNSTGTATPTPSSCAQRAADNDSATATLSTSTLSENSTLASFTYNDPSYCSNLIVAPGDNYQELVWNALIAASVRGFSGNAAAIAGVMGNIQQDSDFDPYLKVDDRYGLLGWPSTDIQPLLAEVTALGDYWHSPDTPSSAPDNIAREAIKAQIIYLVNTPNFQKFLDGLSQTDHQTSELAAASYADLFLVTSAPTPHSSGSGVIIDSFARNLTQRLHYPTTNIRRANAESIYTNYLEYEASVKIAQNHSQILTSSRSDQTILASNNATLAQSSSRDNQIAVAQNTGDINATALAFAREKRPTKCNPKPEYLTAMKTVGTDKDKNNNYDGCRCSAFAATVIRYSGVDPDIAFKGGSSTVSKYLKEHPKIWQYIGTTGKTKGLKTKDDLKKNLQPGDILNNSDHSEIFVRRNNGKVGIAEGGIGDSKGIGGSGSAGHLRNVAKKDLKGYDVYRFVGNVNNIAENTSGKSYGCDGVNSYDGDVGVNVNPGEAAAVAKGDRIKYLFDGKGAPTSSSSMQKYLTTIQVPVLNKQGKQTTMKLTVHKKLAAEYTAVFQDLLNLGFRTRSGDTAAYVWKNVSGTSKRSRHSLGAAIDVNWDANPLVNNTSTYKPNGTDPYKVNDKVVTVWRKHGFYWGGCFSSYSDLMHFDYIDKGSSTRYNICKKQ